VKAKQARILEEMNFLKEHGNGKNKVAEE